eukprot:15337608-Ditylum_brightwellii.AAC.2
MDQQEMMLCHLVERSAIQEVNHLYAMQDQQLIKIHLYLDNESVINRIIWQKSYSYNCLFHIIDPQWGVIAQIVQIFCILSCADMLTHVEDHHLDKDIAYEDLDLLTQLNVNADFLAIEYRASSGRKHKTIPRHSVNKAQLHIACTTITLNYYKFIRLHATIEQLMAYAQEKYGCDSLIINQIDWKAFPDA